MYLTGIMLAVFFVAILGALFGAGIQLPGISGQVRPDRLDQTPPFDRLGVRELGPGRYEVNMVAFIWGYTPNEIRVPAGSTVTFRITSRDVTHGFRVADTTINTMLLPGQVSEFTYTFKKPGTYLFVCHEYCGIGHHTMFGRIIVQ